MRDVIAELKALRLHGMAGTWADLIEQNNAELERSRWLVEQMLRAVLMTLVPVVATAFLTMPINIGSHPGEMPVQTTGQRHMT